MRTINIVTLFAITAVFISGCGTTTSILLNPVENIDKSPLKVSELTNAELQNWGHLDLAKDTIPGMSVDRAYAEIIKNKKGKTVIVAVIDSGIDIDHEDLNDVIWTNEKEIPNNGIDDDKNGYIDDIHGWNFLGDGYNEQLEFVRILASGDTNNPDYKRAKSEYETLYQKIQDRTQDNYDIAKAQYKYYVKPIDASDKILTEYFGKKDYTKEDVYAIKTEDSTLIEAINTAKPIYSKGKNMAYYREKLKKTFSPEVSERLIYHLNKDFKGRVTGDDPNDMSTKYYGNGNVKPIKKSESHGTHVAGIIAAERNNGKGANGVANNVQIMSIRAIPNGDEYDKDVALAIRYAVDNGASVINGSFGKSYSPHSDWVRDAIAYAEKKDVVFVHAAGNYSKDVDTELTFPDDNINGEEMSNIFIRVGALGPTYGSGMITRFSNYGKKNVDVFAPGAMIYSTTPENEYAANSGTSMAAPAVAGVAALIRSYYPKLSAAQVKQIIMNSGLPVKTKVIVGGDTNDVRPFVDISKSAKIVNAYNALIMASKMK